MFSSGIDNSDLFLLFILGGILVFVVLADVSSSETKNQEPLQKLVSPPYTC